MPDERRPLSVAQLLGFGWVVVLVLVAVAYLPVLDGEFIFDDFSTITEGDVIHKLWPPAYLFFARRPVVFFTFALNWAIGGANPVGYRLVNVGIHAAAGLLLWGLVRRTLRMARPEQFDEPRACAFATAVASVWAVHPLHTSAVTYVAHRFESLAGLLLLATFYAFVRARTSPKPARWDALAVLFCALGLLSKEIVVAALPLLILYDWAFVGPDLRTAIKTRWKVHLGVWATLSLPIALFFVSPPWPSQGFGLPDLTPLDYARSQLGVVAHYLRLAAWPNPLSVDYYDWPVARALRDVAAGACVTGTLIGATVVLLVKRPQIGFLGAWFFAILAPTSSILPLQHELLAERRMYLPLAAIVVAIVLGTDTLVRSARAKAVATSLVVAALTCVTVNRNGDYLTAVNLYEHEVRARPNNARAHSWYAYHLASVGRLDEGLREANRGLEIDPGVYRAFHVAGSIALKLGNGPLAVRYLSVALAQTPGALDVRDNMAAAFDLVGDVPMAIAMLRASLAIAPSSAKHYQHLAWYLATDPIVRDGAQALDLAERAASLAGPARTVRYDETLAAANGAAGRFDQAEALARQAAARARAEQIPEAARRLEEAIVAYRSRQPYTIERPQRPPPL